MDAQILTFPAARRGLKAIALQEESKPIDEWDLDRLTDRIEWAASAHSCTCGRMRHDT